jgi:hypothetical protein
VVKTLITLISMIFSLAMLQSNSYGDEGAKHGTKSTHMKVNGVVSKLQPGRTTIKTPWGTMIIASSVTPKRP